jgi:hypothetical protein
VTSAIRLLVAQVEGERVGADRALWDVECPYGFGQMELRSAWKKGFEAGKAQWRLASRFRDSQH